MNITELQTLLHEQAEHVDDQGASVRGSQMQHRIVVAKRRRTAGAVAALAVVLAGTAAGLTSLPGGDSTTPVTPPDRPLFVKTEAGRELIDSVVSDQGAGEASFTTTVDTSRLVLNTECYADGPETHFEVAVNGEYAGGGACTPGEKPEQLGASGVSSSADGGAPWGNLTADGGRFQLEVFTTRGDRGPRVTDPTATLYAGLYRLPEAEDVVAGYEIFPLEEFDGREWQIASHTETEPGQRHFEWPIGGGGPDRLALVFVGSFQGMARISANGELQTTLGGGGGTRFVVPEKNGDRSVEVQLTQETQGTIGIAWYEPVESGE